MKLCFGQVIIPLHCRSLQRASSMNRWIFQCRWLSIGKLFRYTTPNMLVVFLIILNYTDYHLPFTINNRAIYVDILLKNYIEYFRRWSERSISDIRYVPDVYTTFLQLFVCMAIHDTIFYHAHRLVISYYCFIKCLHAYKYSLNFSNG